MTEFFIKPKLKTWEGELEVTFDEYETMEDSATGEQYFVVKGYKTKTLILSVADEDMYYSIDQSIDGDIWANVKTDQGISAGTAVAEAITTIPRYLRVQAKAAVSGSTGTMTAVMEGSTL